MDGQPLIDAQGLGKTYGSLAVLIEANFSVKAGEIRALVGSNGAGKSTLIKILTGAIAPTTGTVKVSGKELLLGSPTEMINNGIACIYQHSNLAPAMSVLDNIFLGRQPTKRFGFLDRKRQRREAEELLWLHGIQLDLDALVSSLSTVKQKEVEILKALALNARVLLMDEPTGWLAASDVAKLHATIRTLKSKGVGIVYISHMLDEIFAICDTVTVVRDGRIISEGKVADITRPKLVKLMVGEKLAEDSAQAGKFTRMARGTGKVRLSAKGMTKRGVFNDISFDLFAGEIFCITGLIGSKRTEFLHTLFGSDKFDSGEMKIDGKAISFHSPTRAISSGIGFVTEDRHREGLMLGLSISNNLVMATLRKFHKFGLLKRVEIHATTDKMIADLNIQPPDHAKAVRLLSGGNQQKVLLGKWLNLKPNILLLDEPTVGVDVGAKAEIYAILRSERDKGAAILVVSSDLEEVMTISDRIAVMASGRLVAIHDSDKTNLSEIIGEIGGAVQ